MKISRQDAKNPQNAKKSFRLSHLFSPRVLGALAREISGSADEITTGWPALCARDVLVRLQCAGPEAGSAAAHAGERRDDVRGHLQPAVPGAPERRESERSRAADHRHRLQ